MANKNYLLNDKFPKAIKNATSSSDGLMSAEDKKNLDSLFEFGYFAPVTPTKDGIMIKEDKAKLDGIEEYANNYIHPTGSEYNHVTDEQIAKWNAVTNTTATHDIDGLMSAEDKAKLDNIETIIRNNSYYFNLNTLIEDKTWGTIDNALGYAVIPFTNYLNANNLSLQNGMTILIKTSNTIFNIEDDMTRNIWQEWTLLDKTNYRKKAAWHQNLYNDATITNNGLMSKEDKAKLDELQNYEHPQTHNASIIQQDETHRFVTDEQIANWNNSINASLATQTANGLMSASDKKKLDSIITGANYYEHPETHNADIIVQDESHRFVTDEQIAYWNSKPGDNTLLENATQTSDGLMSKEDKISLDNALIKINELETKYDEMLAKLKTAIFI